MKFSGLTKKGRLYLAKIQAAEEPIQFTKIKFGDGKLSEHENPADLVDIKNIKVEKSILNKEQKEDAVILTTIIDNVGLVEGYFPRETGIYVQDEDQEVLYFYMNDGDETSWLPPEVDGPHKMEIKINLISSNTGSVLVHNDGKDLYITKDYLESNYTQKGNFNGTAQDIEDRVVAAVGKEDGKFPLTESVAGNIYYFPGNKKFYYCLKSQTSRVSVPNADFEELSIYQNRKKLENLFTTKEEKTKLSLAQINNVNLNTITEPGFYTSSGWSNNIVNLPAELNHNEGRAFYLLVFALENGAYCQQILYSFKGLIFYRAITGANSAFTQWKNYLI
ncbi:hypothetical protein FSCG_02165 [Fusobacterium vincentii 4_1_13]|uniref:Phage tail fibre protein N-terminal domain-containing protein n=1 Tax=Fusobacterium vincentii 4_1_13 TaxID=469606 RepID=A0A0K9CLG9_FUSVC|nr:phage tail protein [Fusobacterium vincentii]KMV74445.1 hypothetical protein FSCG_02165 [Fusobacterium vincentii 4_1_13]